MRVSTKGRYALRVMIDMAKNGVGEFVPLHILADRQGISEKYLENILGLLVRNGLVAGVRGKGGGYRLSRKSSEYNVWEILSKTETSSSPVECLENGAGCARAEFCPTLPMWKGLNEVIRSYLESITLEQLVQNAPKTNLPFCSDDWHSEL